MRFFPMAVLVSLSKSKVVLRSVGPKPGRYKLIDTFERRLIRQQ
jgi:hypothetical protein